MCHRENTQSRGCGLCRGVGLRLRVIPNVGTLGRWRVSVLAWWLEVGLRAPPLTSACFHISSSKILRCSPTKAGGHCDSIRRCEAIRRLSATDRVRGFGDLSHVVILANCAKMSRYKKMGEGQDQAILTYSVGPVHMKKQTEA